VPTSRARRSTALLSCSRFAPAARDAGNATTAVAAAFARLLFQEGEARQEVVDSHSRGLDPLPQGPALLLEVGDPVPAPGLRLPARARRPSSRPPANTAGSTGVALRKPDCPRWARPPPPTGCPY